MSRHRSRPTALAMLLVLTAFVVSLSAQTRTSGSVSPGRTISITSEPNAVIWIDDVRYGITDKRGTLTISTLSPGAHVLRVRADGFKEKTLSLSAAQKGEIKAALVKTSDNAELAFQEAERLAGVDRDKSAEAYNRATALRPNYAEAYVGLARVQTELGDTEAAEKSIVSARKFRPSYAEASAVEGRIFKEDGEDAKAVASFKRAITEGKGLQPEAYTGLGLLYKEKAEGFGGAGDFEKEAANYDEAAKNLKMGVKQLSGAPDAIVVYQLLGLIYERQKKLPEAIAVYEEFLRIFPNSSESEAVRSFIVQLKKDIAARN